MKRLPPRFAPFVYGIIQAAITTAVATAIATHQLASQGMAFLWHWLGCWALSWVSMLPIVILVAPLISCSARTIARAAFGKGDFLLWLGGNHLGVLPVLEELGPTAAVVQFANR